MAAGVLAVFYMCVYIYVFRYSSCARRLSASMESHLVVWLWTHQQDHWYLWYVGLPDVVFSSPTRLFVSMVHWLTWWCLCLAHQQDHGIYGTLVCLMWCLTNQQDHGIYGTLVCLMWCLANQQDHGIYGMLACLMLLDGYQQGKLLAYLNMQSAIRLGGGGGEGGGGLLPCCHIHLCKFLSVCEHLSLHASVRGGGGYYHVAISICASFCLCVSISLYMPVSVCTF